jgi:GH25 family lysozyme M1 (1,4-beta-N-acetylmuramidase)
VFTVAQGLFNPDGNKENYGDSGTVIPIYGPWLPFPEWPISQGVHADDQPVMVLEERTDGWLRIQTFHRDNWDPLAFPPEDFPYLYTIDVPSVQMGTGARGNAIDSRGVLWPLLSRSEAWLPPGSVEYIDNFDEFKKDVTPVVDPIDSYTKGKDFSHHADFHKPGLSTDDTAFAILKGGDGWWQDPRTQPGGDLYESIEDYEVRGDYHYYRTGVSWKRQADLLLERLENPYFHFGAWDYERKNNILDGAAAGFCQMAMEYLTSNTEKRILLYSNVRGFNEDLRPYDLSSIPWYNDHDLWIAQWPWKIWIDKISKFEPTMPKDVDHWEIWQYGADSLGCYGYKEAHLYGLGKDSVDLNYYPGSLAEMKIAFSVTSQPEPPVDPLPVPADEAAIREDELAKMDEHIANRRADL